MTRQPCDNPDPPPGFYDRVRPLHDAWLARQQRALAEHSTITPYGWFVEGVEWAEQQRPALLKQAKAVIAAWERLGKCEDEFYPEYPGSCSEYADALDTALDQLRQALG